MTITSVLEAGLVSVIAGLLGSLLGLGGGLFVTPLLSGPMGIDIHHATAASITGVVATSSTGGAGYLRRDLPNVRLGMLLETGTVVGAIIGTLLNGMLSGRVLAAAFAVVLLYAAISLLRRPAAHTVTADPLAERLGLCAHYPVGRLRLGLAASVLAGVVSGLLGVGGGLVLVPVMVAFMGIPLKIATATSTFMIGVTGVASACIQLLHGAIDPSLAAPVIVGIFGGATLGPWLAPRISAGLLRTLFLLAIGLSIAQMLVKATGP
ncbi:MAG TPA: sulfite exporter TauE/SafE family protein [Chloroflexota bacterium]|nr:sulfite exporter TauE/SafE family protein [Chloroflexota bacterium]